VSAIAIIAVASAVIALLLAFKIDKLYARLDALEDLVEQMGPPYLSDKYPETTCIKCDQPATGGGNYCALHFRQAVAL
jgi:hypothetical protein